MRASEFIDEDINRRDLLKGVAGAAALGAAGLAKAGEYKPYDELIKDKEALVNVWGPRLEQLQQRANAMLNKLARTAGPAWAKQLAGTQLVVQSNDQYLQANAENKSISMDITVFWDAPDDVLAFAIAHELGHIALGHVGDVTPVQSRKEELAADDFAVKLCKALGYNKAGLFKFMHNKEAYFWSNLKSSSADSTHPNFDQRINRAKKQGFQLSKGGIQQLNTLKTHLA
jgi:Zn-dependent protease with chaperone function